MMVYLGLKYLPPTRASGIYLPGGLKNYSPKKVTNFCPVCRLGDVTHMLMSECLSVYISSVCWFVCLAVSVCLFSHGFWTKLSEIWVCLPSSVPRMPLFLSPVTWRV